MTAPRQPNDETERLEALRRFDILDTEPEQRFDDLAALAAQICDAPIALVSIIDDTRQWFKAAIGLSIRETSRDVSFCGHAILEPDVFVVPDAAADERFAGNPLVTGDLSIRFYAGAPLVTGDGRALGALCVMDRIPRQLTAAQQEALRALSRQVMSQLELGRQSRALADSEARLLQVFHSCPVGLAVHRLPERTFVDINPAFTSLLGWTRDDVIGRTAAEVNIVDEAEAARLRGRLTAEHRLRGVEVPVRTRDGEIRHAILGTALVELRGHAHAVSTFVDVTARRRADEALRDNEERLRVALDAARMGTFDWNVTADRVTGSSAFDAMFGFRPGESDGTYGAFVRRVHAEDLPGLEADVARSVATGAPFRPEFRVVWPDGRILWIAAWAEVVRGEHGRPTRLRGAVMDTTARRAAEEASREKSAQLQTALDVARMGVWCWDFQSDQVYTIQGSGPISGLPPGLYPQTGAAFIELVHPEDRARVTRELSMARVRGTYDSVFRIKPPDGAIRWVAARAEVVLDEHGTAVLLTGVDRDITDQTLAEEALREHKDRLATIIETEPACVKTVDRQGRLLQMNKAGLAMLEVDSLAEAQESTLVDYLLPEHRRQFGHLHHKVFGGESGIIEFEIQGRRGTRRWLETHAAPLRDAAGRVYALLGVTRDVTERRAAVERIRHLNRVYAVLSDINQTIVRELDPQAMLETACRIAVSTGEFRMAWIGLADGGDGELRVAAHAGATDDTLAFLRVLLAHDHGDPDCAFTSHALREGEHAVCNDIASDPRAAAWRQPALDRNYRSMASLPLKDGARVIGTFNLYAGAAQTFDDEEIRLLDELATDISFALTVHARERERRRTDEALRASEERFRELAANIQEVFWMTDPAERRILYVSPAYEEIWGRPCDSLYAVPNHWLDAVHPDDRERIAVAASTRQASGDYDETYRIVRSDGTIRWIHERAFPVLGVHGDVVRIVGTAEDITRQRALEEQLRQAQKMEAIGQLAGGVAHDFNNILTVIQGYGELLMTTLTPQDAADAARQILMASERAANLTRQLLTFSRRQVMQPRPLDLNEIVTSLTTMLQRIVGEDVRLQLTLHSRPLMTRADAGMLDQVLMNLVVNARDAMPDGGQLSIETTTQRVADPEVPAGIPCVCFRVSDTGSGIAPEHLTHIFEPFFTTKAPGKGTGLGLATVFGIVNQHGGSVAVKSEIGHGTTFSVCLPADHETRGVEDEPEAEPAPRRGTETILLVEDEPGVRMLARVVLERQGYRVLEAAHGVEALELWHQHPLSIHLLLTDIVMPEGLSGRDLAARLLAGNPDIRIVFTSGYSADIAGRELSLQEGQNFIQKPFSPQQLLQTVGRCLDR